MAKFTLEIEMGGIVNTPVHVAELLTFVLNEIRQDGFTPGMHDINTRSLWRQSKDGQSSELVSYTVGKWEVIDETLCGVCGVSASEHGHWNTADPTIHKWVSK